MMQETLMRRVKGDIEMIEHRFADGTTRMIPHWRRAHAPMMDVNKQCEESLTPLERLALAVAVHVGSPGFFLITACWTIAWFGWNLVGPGAYRFDPAPAFVLWLFVSNIIQILLLPLIVAGQNLSTRHSEMRAEADFAVNQKAEQEVEVILLHLEHLTASVERQGEQLMEVLRLLQKRSS